MRDDITIEPLDPADIELVAPLWKQLMDHVASLPEGLVPVRPSDESWELERAEMLRELAGEAFVLVARKDEAIAGYAFVCVEGPDPVWYTGDRHAVLATLCVDAAERGDGIGGALLDAVDAELERRGVEDVEIGVDTGNEAAARLYESRGYRAGLPHLLRLAGRQAVGLPAPRGRGQGSRARPLRAARPRRGAHMSAPRYVSVIGASRATPELAAKAEELGELLAERGLVVVCGGREGVMEAVARGVKRAGGVSIGILPEADRHRAAPDLTYTVCSAMGYARNLSVVASGDVVIALGGAWGTLSEIALARNVGKPVILLDTWTIAPPGGGELDGVRRAATPAEAVELALTLEA